MWTAEIAARVRELWNEGFCADAIQCGINSDYRKRLKPKFTTAEVRAFVEEQRALGADLRALTPHELRRQCRPMRGVC
jgi:glycine/D-amino acid oxidase-like deaminating enzyme